MVWRSCAQAAEDSPCLEDPGLDSGLFLSDLPSALEQFHRLTYGRTAVMSCISSSKTSPIKCYSCISEACTICSCHAGCCWTWRVWAAMPQQRKTQQKMGRRWDPAASKRFAVWVVIVKLETMTNISQALRASKSYAMNESKSLTSLRQKHGRPICRTLKLCWCTMVRGHKLRDVMAACPFLQHGMVQKDVRVCLQAPGCSSLHVQLPRCKFQSAEVFHL